MTIDFEVDGIEIDKAEVIRAIECLSRALIDDDIDGVAGCAAMQVMVQIASDKLGVKVTSTCVEDKDS